MKLFISYSRDDKAWVYELWRDLRDRAYHDAWIDQRLIPAQDWWATILQNIETCECCIYVMTPQSVASIYCGAEVDYALTMHKPILPLMLKPCDYPENLRKLHVQYQVIKDDMNLGDVLFITERAMGEVREGLAKGKYQLPQPAPPRPDEPKPEQTSEQVLEVFMLAEEAASENNLSLAERHFQQVMEADPEGYGPAATQRMKEIRDEHTRKSDYERIAQMVNDPALQKGAQKLWQVFVRKYGSDYDPNGLATGFTERSTTPVPEAKPVILDQAISKEDAPPPPIAPAEVQQVVRQEVKPVRAVQLPPLREDTPIVIANRTHRNWTMIAAFVVVGIIVVVLLMTSRPGGHTEPPTDQGPIFMNLTVPGTADEVDSGIFVQSGQTITINATGEVSSCRGDDLADWCAYYGPDGGYLSMPEANGGGPFPLPGAMLVALIGRIGNGDPFPVGTQYTISADRSGELYFVVNDNVRDDNRGAFELTVRVE